MRAFPLILLLSTIDWLARLWSRFWAEAVVQGVFTTFVVFLIVKTAGRVSRLIQAIRGANSQFSLTGIWIGSCTLPAWGNKEAIEIYRLVVKNELVRMTFFVYLPDKPVQTCEGGGIFRVGQLSAFYYVPAPDVAESGVFLVRHGGTMLRGFYAQYDPRITQELVISKPEKFLLMRTRLSVLKQLGMILHRKPVRTYEEAKKLYDEACQEHLPPDNVTPSSLEPETQPSN